MKLPTENENAESAGSPNQEPANDSREPQSSERSGTDVNGAEVNGSAATAGDPSQDPDFSEFLWMENENEFDEQVLKELEDEEMMNYYYELYEASQEAENQPQPAPRGRGRGRGGGGGGGSWRDHGQQHNPHYHHQQQMPAACAGYENPRVDPYASNQPRGDVDDITQGVNSMNFNAPRFNPDAAEFVPRAPTAVSAGGRDDNDRPPPDNQ